MILTFACVDTLKCYFALQLPFEYPLKIANTRDSRDFIEHLKHR